jgi:2'-5' RNA ligase
VYLPAVKRALVMFPAGDTLGVIEEIRARYDPQASFISAHVTLVFPFSDNLADDDLRAHLAAATAGMAPFAARFEQPREFDDGYIALAATTGRRELMALHDRLYTGPLARHLSPVHTYRPHVTLARVDDPRGRPAVLDAIRRQSPMIAATLHEVAIFTIRN